MKGDLMRRTKYIFISLAALALCCEVLMAQETEQPPLVLGGFDTQGSATVGYRFDDIKGYRPMFQDLSGLNTGFRLLDFSMFGEAAKGANPFADSFSMSVSGLGGNLLKWGR